jgi:alcohol dehydrogenase (cytochrome c)
LFYIPSWVNYSSVYIKAEAEYEEGKRFVGTSPRSLIGGAAGGGSKINTRKDDEGYGAVRAIDPMTGDRKWEFKMNDVTDAGVLTTGSDLLFSGGREGYFYALNARNGELLWKANVGGAVASGPMSYAVNGKQYFAISAGSSLFVYGLRE